MEIWNRPIAVERKEGGGEQWKGKGVVKEHV